MRRWVLVVLAAACGSEEPTVVPVPKGALEAPAMAPTEVPLAPLPEGFDAGGGQLSADATLPDILLRCADDLDIVPGCFVKVPGRTALVGSQRADPKAPGYDEGGRADEAPPHEASAPELWVMSTEATVGMYAVCQQAGKCAPWAGKDGAADPTVAAGANQSHPVREITWSQAGELCAYLGGRLPTEEEWEVIARGADGRRFGWGDSATCPFERGEDGPDAGAERRQALLDGCPALQGALKQLDKVDVEALGAAMQRWGDAELDGLCGGLKGDPAADAATLRQRTAATWSRLPPRQCDKGGVGKAIMHDDHHPDRLWALSAHVSEWTASAYRKSYADPEPAEEGVQRVARGGSYDMSDPTGWRLAARRPLDPAKTYPDVGVRCVREAMPAEVVTTALFKAE